VPDRLAHTTRFAEVADTRLIARDRLGTGWARLLRRCLSRPRAFASFRGGRRYAGKLACAVSIEDMKFSGAATGVAIRS